MPADPASQTALIVIAVAVSIQTLVMVGAVVGAVIAWKRVQTQIEHVEHRYRALAARVDEAVIEARHAAEAVHRVSDQTSDALDRAGQVVGAVSTLLTAPRQLVLAGAASLASRWLRGRRRPSAATPWTPVRSRQ